MVVIMDIKLSLFNLAWIGFLGGIISGAILGLLFHNEEFMGGYNSFRRRLTRLGHISFFGIGIVNLLIALSKNHLDLSLNNFLYINIAMMITTITMPLLCFLSAWKKSFRHLFFIPVLGFGFSVFMILLNLDF
jgi:hypothetical protein